MACRKTLVQQDWGLEKDYHWMADTRAYHVTWRQPDREKTKDREWHMSAFSSLQAQLDQSLNYRESWKVCVPRSQQLNYSSPKQNNYQTLLLMLPSFSLSSLPQERLSCSPHCVAERRRNERMSEMINDLNHDYSPAIGRYVQAELCRNPLHYVVTRCCTEKPSLVVRKQPPQWTRLKLRPMVPSSNVTKHGFILKSMIRKDCLFDLPIYYK